MQHSINYIAKEYSNLSNMRKEVNPFKETDFIEFAKNNKSKYGIIDNGDDMLVSTWYSADLINDYKKTLK